jgi:hypothetical protein
VRKADHPDPRGSNLGCRTQKGGAVEAIARLCLGRYQAAAIADLLEPTRTETVDQQRRKPPSRKTARPLAIVPTHPVAAVQNDYSPCRRATCQQIKLGRRVAERRPDFGGIKDLGLGVSRRPAQQDAEQQQPAQIPTTRTWCWAFCDFIYHKFARITWHAGH